MTRLNRSAPSLSEPWDLRLVLHRTLPASYELSDVLLAKAAAHGTLQLLTSAWERVLGYARADLDGKTLYHFMWSNARSAAAAVAAILDERDMGPVILRLRCRNGIGKSLTLHRLYDRQERMIYIVAEEKPDAKTGKLQRHEERRSALRGRSVERTRSP
jgi:hypothetical protein